MIRNLAFLLFVAAGLLRAADVGGRWSGSLKMAIDGSDVDMPQELVLKQAGDAVTGTAGPGPEQQWPITKGQLTGNTLTLEVRVEGGPVLEYRLTVAGAEMTGDYKMTLEGQASSAKVTLKKR